MTGSKIHPKVSIGHVHLKVADLERALGFYCGVLGFEVTQRYGHGAVFISAGGYHHHIGLNTWESFGGSPPPPGTTGLFHLAILYPTRAALSDALRFISATRIKMAWNCIGTDRKPNGRAGPTELSQCLRGLWISMDC
jgi:catechol 2,3-dioxygenase